MDDLDLLAALTLGMALMNSADLRCAFKRGAKLFGDGDKDVSGRGSEVGPQLRCCLPSRGDCIPRLPNEAVTHQATYHLTPTISIISKQY